MKTGFKPRKLVLALVLGSVVSPRALLAASPAVNLPAGPTVVRGQANVVIGGRNMTVTNSAGAVLDWQSFSVGSGYGVRFQQPSASSKVLNRVVGRDPSNIFGSISSNGEVWLLNPYGVLFGRDARVDVASLVVSTLNIGNDDWRNQRFALAGGNGGRIDNHGELRAAGGGRVLLLAGDGGVANDGLIVAADGQIALAAGRSIEVADTSTRNVAVQVTAPGGNALNLGTLQAGGGRIDIWAAAANQSGVARADTLSGAGGRIVMRASESVATAPGSVTSASGRSGGEVTVDAGTGSMLVGGSITATGSDGRGGSVRVLGRQIGLLDGSVIDASGAAGGDVAVGGGRQGRDAALANAEALYMGPGAAIRADATGRGDGGSIVLWSDHATRAYGSLSARGGAGGGDGGFIETSGGWLDARPASVRTDAPAGRAGNWLIDPNNIFIVDGGVDTNVGSGPVYTTTGDSAVLTTQSIVNALNQGSDVSILTGTGGTNSQAGDIVMFGGTIAATPQQPVTLTMIASRNISVQSSTIRSASGTPLGVNLAAAGGGAGTVSIDNSTIESAGGNVTLGGQTTAVGTHGSAPFLGAIGYDGNGTGVLVTRSRIDAGSGSLSMFGSSLATSTVSGSAQGVAIGGGSTLAARDIDLRGWVDSNGNLDRTGVVVDAGTTLTATETLRLTGRAYSDVAFAPPLDGVRIGGNLAVVGAAAPGTALTIDGGVGGSAAGAPANAVRVTSGATLAGGGAETASIVGQGDIRLDSNYQTVSNIYTSSGGTTTIASTGGNVIASDYFQISGSAASLNVSAESIQTGYLPVTLTGSGNITFNADSISGQPYLQTPGTIALQANSIDLSYALLQSNAAGDAITVRGRSPGTNVAHLIVNQSGSSTFQTPNGRWLAYATDPSDTDNFNLSQEPYDASVYNATAGAAFDAGPYTASGRLLLFSVAPTLSLTQNATITRDYDGTVSVDVAPFIQVNGLLAGDVLTGLSGTYDDKNAGPRTVTLPLAQAAVQDATGHPVFGYGLPGTGSYAGEITPRPVTLFGAGADDKFYDGTTAASASVGGVSNLVGGESLGVALLGAEFDGSDALPNRSVTLNAVLTNGGGGGLASNYVLVGGNVATASILPRPLTLSGVTADDKIYDGGTTASATGGALSNLVAGQTLGVESAAQFEDPHAAPAKNVNVSTVLVDGSGLASNYVLTNGTTTTQANILPRPLTVHDVAIADKTYDGTRTAQASSYSVDNDVFGDLQFQIAAQFDTQNAGTAKPVIGSVTVLDGFNGSLASDYTIASGSSFSTTASILRKDLTLAGVAASGKVYDGSRSAAVAGGALAGLVGSETLTVSLSAANFDTKDAGVGKTVTATAALLDGGNGGLASNYNLPDAAVVAQADITQRPVSLAGTTAATKVYDGSRGATLAGGLLSNVVAGEALVVGYADGLFDNKNAGSGKSVTGTATLADGAGGGLASNYVLTGGATVATSGDIVPRTVTLAGARAADKVYDGNRAAALDAGAATLGNLVGSETLGVTLSAGQFDSADAGSGKTVTGSATLLDGSGGGLASNYALADTGVVTARAEIQRRSVTLTDAVAQSKTYDGSRVAVVGGGTLANLVGSETLTLAYAAAQFDSKDAGTAKPVTAIAALADGGNGGRAQNYVLASPTVVASADVLPQPLNLSGVAAADKIYDGNVAAALSGGVLNGLVGGETLGLSLTGRFENANAGSGKAVLVGAALADGGGGGLAGNYRLAPSGNASASIAPRAVTLGEVGAADKVYDGTRAAALGGGVLTNLVGSETLALMLNGQFDAKDAGARSVAGSATLADGANGGVAANYVLAGGGNFSAAARIDPRPLSLAGVAAAAKTYDGSTQASFAGATLAGLVGSETLTVNLSGAFVARDAGSARPVAGTATLADGGNGGLASNYTLPIASFSTAADIAQRPLQVVGATVNDKVYDGTRNGSVSGWSLAGVLAGDTVSVGGGAAQFAQPGVAAASPATAVAGYLAGTDAGNYRLGTATAATSAAVLPATLSYLATPASAVAGSATPALGGSVVGFVGGETAAGATAGSLHFDTAAVPTSPPGSYAIAGSGLTASNYVFAQAPTNAVALTIVPATAGTPTPPSPAAMAELAMTQPPRREALLAEPQPAVLLQPVAAPFASRAVDALRVPGLQSSGSGATFGAVDIAAMSRDALAALLEARSRYKRSVLDAALRQLEVDPTLADAPACERLPQAEAGGCVVTEALVAQAQGERITIVAPPPTPAAAASVATAPSAARPVVRPAAPTAAPGAVALAARVNAVATVKPPQLPSPRQVRSAKLPQIERKLAVLIGLDNYADERIPSLANSARDADAVAAVLQDKLGYETLVVHDASREAILGTLNALALQARPSDSVVIYYAGHGERVEKTGAGYWLPSSAVAERPETWISNTDIDRVLASIRASQVVLISDSCYSGNLIGEQRAALSPQDLADPSAILGRRAAFAMSSGGDEPVADGGKDGHSPFAWSLMRSLEQVSDWRPGGNIFERVRYDVARQLPQRPRYGTLRAGGNVVGSEYLFESRSLEGVILPPR